MTGVLRNRAFRWIAASLLLDSLLEWFGTVALMALVYDRTHSTTVAAGLLLCKQVIPGALVPFVGAKLDRLSVGRSLAAAFAVQAATLIVIGLVGYGAPLFVLAVSSGIAGTLVRSLLRTGFARALDGPELRSGNAFSNMGVSITGLFGPALAAFVVSQFGAAPALIGAGLATCVCSLFAMRIPKSPQTVVAEVAADSPSVRNPRPQVPLGWLLACVAALIFIGSVDEPALLAYSEHALGAGIGGYGAILACWGVGMTIGSIIFARLLDQSMIHVSAAASVGIAVALVGLGLSPTIAVTCVLSVVGGLGNGICWVALVTAVQEAAPAGKDASTAARLESIVSAAPGAGVIVGGFLADVAGVRSAFLMPGILAIGVLCIATVAVRLRDPNLRGVAAPNFFATTPGGSA